MWEAVERQPGVYNMTYLDEVDRLITKLGEAGIYTLVDAHQDVLARAVCGEGMPNFYAHEILKHGSYCFSKFEDWLITPIVKKTGFCKSIHNYGYKFDADGNPIIADC